MYYMPLISIFCPLLTLKIPNILELDWLNNDINKSMIDIVTNEPSIIFQPDVKYASVP